MVTHAPTVCSPSRHGEWAAGIFSLIKVTEMMRRRVFLPSAGCKHPRDDFDWKGNNMCVQQEPEPFPPKEYSPPVIVGVDSAAIGGSLGHAALQEYRAPANFAKVSPATPFPLPLLFPLSAASDRHLKVKISRLLQRQVLEDRLSYLWLENIFGDHSDG